MKKFRDMISEDEIEANNGDHPIGKWFNIVNPETGRRYEIPMLDTLDPDYVFKYVEMMKTKEETPELFDKIMDWK